MCVHVLLTFVAPRLPFHVLDVDTGWSVTETTHHTAVSTDFCSGPKQPPSAPLSVISPCSLDSRRDQPGSQQCSLSLIGVTREVLTSHHLWVL